MKTYKMLMMLLAMTLTFGACQKSEADVEPDTDEKMMESLTIRFESDDKDTDTTIMIHEHDGNLHWMLDFADQGKQEGEYDTNWDIEDKFDELAAIASSNMPDDDDDNKTMMDDDDGDYSITVIYKYKTSDSDSESYQTEEIVLNADNAKELVPFMNKSKILHILPDSVKDFPPTSRRYWYRDRMHKDSDDKMMEDDRISDRVPG